LFVGVLGHDLRNPLSAIASAATLLEARADSERISTPVKRIASSAARMDRMISQLLDLTRIRWGRGIPLDRKPVELTQLSQSIIDELEPVYQRSIHLESKGNGSGHWDHDRLAQMLSNLVANACQHGASGALVAVMIEGSSETEVCLLVQNQGAIDPRVLPVIFEPLGHSGAGRERHTGSSGLGLGLFIARQIAMAHGGSIEVSSDEQHGTRFVVRLPRAQDAEVARTTSPWMT
jgi:signal transduction histidine kinase